MADSKVGTRPRRANGEGRGDLIRVIAYTGMRISEMFALPADLVSLPTSVLTVADTVTESGGRRVYKRGRGKSLAAQRYLRSWTRRCPLSSALRRSDSGDSRLEPEREARRAARDAAGKPNKRGPNRPLGERWLLTASGEQGGFMSYGSWRKRLAVAQEACGVSYDADDLRHVAASILYALGEGVREFGSRSDTLPSAPPRASTGTCSRWTAPRWRGGSRPSRPPSLRPRSPSRGRGGSRGSAHAHGPR